MVKKISIIGAGGVGSTLAYTILNRVPPKELVLLDIAKSRVCGAALDLEDTRGILKFSTDIKPTADYNDIKNSDLIVITAGIARKKGMTRLDLLKINGEIAKEAAKNIKRYAPQSIIITVTNPLDLITYLVFKESGFNRRRVIGMGSSLDSSRLINIVHKATKADVASIEGYVWGPHSKEMIVPSSFSQKIREAVAQRGAEIVGYLKSGSAHFAPAQACCYLIETIVADKKEVVPVSLYLEGEYGLNGLCLGVPAVIGLDGVIEIIEAETTLDEKEQLRACEKLFKECMT